VKWEGVGGGGEGGGKRLGGERLGEGGGGVLGEDCEESGEGRRGG